MNSTLQTIHDLQNLESLGKKMYGNHFEISKEDYPVINKIETWFIQDVVRAEQLNINLKKGILLSGPIGAGKTSIMKIFRVLFAGTNPFIIKSCREITFEFSKDGYEVIQKYSSHSFDTRKVPFKSITYCFDDLGVESNLNYFGVKSNIMAEILLSRYDQFIDKQMLTHITTNLSANDIENMYGNRVRSRMREMFNLISFDSSAKDKRQ